MKIGAPTSRPEPLPETPEEEVKEEPIETDAPVEASEEDYKKRYEELVSDFEQMSKDVLSFREAKEKEVAEKDAALKDAINRVKVIKDSIKVALYGEIKPPAA